MYVGVNVTSPICPEGVFSTKFKWKYVVFNFLCKGFSHSALPLLVPIWAPLLVLLLWSINLQLYAGVCCSLVHLEYTAIDDRYGLLPHCDSSQWTLWCAYDVYTERIWDWLSKMIGYIAFAVKKKTINSNKMVAWSIIHNNIHIFYNYSYQYSTCIDQYSNTHNYFTLPTKKTPKWPFLITGHITLRHSVSFIFILEFDDESSGGVIDVVSCSAAPVCSFSRDVAVRQRYMFRAHCSGVRRRICTFNNDLCIIILLLWNKGMAVATGKSPTWLISIIHCIGGNLAASIFSTTKL